MMEAYSGLLLTVPLNRRLSAYIYHLVQVKLKFRSCGFISLKC
jgi:hypothetical protein